MKSTSVYPSGLVPSKPLTDRKKLQWGGGGVKANDAGVLTESKKMAPKEGEDRDDTGSSLAESVCLELASSSDIDSSEE